MLAACSGKSWHCILWLISAIGDMALLDAEHLWHPERSMLQCGCSSGQALSSLMLPAACSHHVPCWLPASWCNAGAHLLTQARHSAAVYIVDSSELPAYKAEVYHQFHNGIGKAYPSSYTQGLRESFLKDGRLRPSGCPELRF